MKSMIDLQLTVLLYNADIVGKLVNLATYTYLLPSVPR